MRNVTRSSSMFAGKKKPPDRNPEGTGDPFRDQPATMSRTLHVLDSYVNTHCAERLPQIQQRGARFGGQYAPRSGYDDGASLLPHSEVGAFSAGVRGKREAARSMVGPTDQTLSCAARAHVPKPERHAACLHLK